MTASANLAQYANNSPSWRNRIINGAMVIDQRNAGASVSIQTSNPTYTLDRWGCGATQNSRYTCQQNAGSVTPPVGFTRYLGITSSSAYSILSSDYFYFSQRIEGFNMSDLAWGTANARTVTLSFWARSSLTGTFGGSITNANYDRSYVYTYTISAANTWEYKTVTIPGCIDGTWGSTNTLGMNVCFSFGVGSTNSGTAGSWVSTGLLSATGATSLVGTNGATLYITGVQLEVGSQSTNFEYRDYTRELQMCQRYLPVWDAANGNTPASSQNISTTQSIATIPFQVKARTAPSGITVTNTSSICMINSTGGQFQATNVAYILSGDSSSSVNVTIGSASLVAGNASIMFSNNTPAPKILFNGCEL